MYRLIRSLLFKLDPENAHYLTLQLMRLGGIQPLNALLRMIYAAPPKPVQAFGLTFRNPVGLAAGYDKDGIAVQGLSALGFGHIEVGTVTPRPQEGNPRPRVFRLVEDEAVINRMGFPGKGADFVSLSLRGRPPQSNDTIIGVNLGKNQDTPLEEAAGDYVALMDIFAPLADYLTINISSPNTVGLRRLQGREMLEELLGEVKRSRITNQWSTPVLVKLAPDLTSEELDDALGVILDTGMDGVIATNTTVSRPELRSRHQEERGGLSGSPLRVCSEVMLEKIVRRIDGRIPVVSTGGIMSPGDAKRRLDMGAALVQVYTGLVYRGPGLVREIIRSL
jgi:dihydroorotate dehydrogenase